MSEIFTKRADILRQGIRGEACNLSPLAFRHTDYVVAWRNDPANARWFLTQEIFTAEKHEAWLRMSLAKDNDFNWVIETSEGLPVGTVGLYHVDWTEKRAEFGRLLVGKSDSRRSGLGREASSLVLTLARKAGLEETYLDVKSDNVAAMAIYRGLNFHVVNEADGIVRMKLCLVDDR